jgi:uncharacterized protein
MEVRIEFDWDPVKAASNLTKHKVSFDEAMTVFKDPLALSRPDEDKNREEERWITVGLTRNNRLLLVIHSYADLAPDHTYVRIISARPPTKREKRQYEQATD